MVRRAICPTAFVLAASLAMPVGWGPDRSWAQAPTVNACGCYQDAAGACVCSDKKAKCVCPNECEPVGCEAKRHKREAKEADAQLKRIAAREKKNAAAAKKAAAAEKKKPAR